MNSWTMNLLWTCLLDVFNVTGLEKGDLIVKICVVEFCFEQLLTQFSESFILQDF